MQGCIQLQSQMNKKKTKSINENYKDIYKKADRTTNEKALTLRRKSEKTKKKRNK